MTLIVCIVLNISICRIELFFNLIDYLKYFTFLKGLITILSYDIFAVLFTVNTADCTYFILRARLKWDSSYVYIILTIIFNLTEICLDNCEI